LGRNEPGEDLQPFGALKAPIGNQEMAQVAKADGRSVGVGAAHAARTALATSPHRSIDCGSRLIDSSARYITSRAAEPL